MMEGIEERIEQFEAASKAHLNVLEKVKEELQKEGVYEEISDDFSYFAGNIQRMIEAARQSLERQKNAETLLLAAGQIEKLVKKSPNLVKIFQATSYNAKKSRTLRSWYARKWRHIKKVYNDIVKKLDEEYNQVQANEQDRALSGLSNIRKKDTIRDSFNVDKHNIHLIVKSDISFIYDKIGVEKISNYIDEKAESFMKEDNKKYLQQLKNCTPSQKKTVLLIYIRETVKYILNKHPDLIRTDVNLHVEITKDKNMYEASKSNFSNAWIQIQLNPDMIHHILLNNQYFPEDTRSYEVLIHELTHAFDWHLQEDKDNVETAEAIFGESFDQKQLLYTDILSGIRSEVVPKFAQAFRKDKPRYMPLTNIRNLSKNLRLYPKIVNRLQQDIGSFDPSKDSPREKSHNIYTEKSNILHKYARFITEIISIREFHDAKIFISQSESVKDYFRDKDKAFQKAKNDGVITLINTSNMQNHIYATMNENYEIYLKIPEDGEKKVKDIVNKLSLMNTYEFLRYYLHCCREIGFKEELMNEETIFPTNL